MRLGAVVLPQLARAVQHIHSRGVVHRGICLEAVALGSDGVRATLCDFEEAHIGDDAVTDSRRLSSELENARRRVFGNGGRRV